MKAVYKLKDGKDGWELRDIPRLDPKPGEVEIEVKNVGICGSELHLYHDRHFYIPPVVVGHEFSGVISKVGDGVEGWKVGDKVVSENHFTACGHCEYCRAGLMQFCPERKAVGYVLDGYWREYCYVPAWLLHKVPDEVSLEEAALTEPTSIVVHALCERAPVQAGDIILVQGCGPIGMLAAMTAKAAGAGKVILTGTAVDREVRLPVARKLGLDRVIDISETDLKSEIMDMTNGRGVDMVVDASGAKEAINEAVDLVKKRGTILAIGETAEAKIPFRWVDTIFRAASIIFTFGSSYKAWELSLDFMAKGKINVKALISHRMPLEKFHEGFQLLDEKKAVKVILKPHDN